MDKVFVYGTLMKGHGITDLIGYEKKMKASEDDLQRSFSTRIC